MFNIPLELKTFLKKKSEVYINLNKIMYTYLISEYQHQLEVDRKYENFYHVMPSL